MSKFIAEVTLLDAAFFRCIDLRFDCVLCWGDEDDKWVRTRLKKWIQSLYNNFTDSNPKVFDEIQFDSCRKRHYDCDGRCVRVTQRNDGKVRDLHAPLSRTFWCHSRM